MQTRKSQILFTLAAIGLLAVTLGIWPASQACAQATPEVYTATVIASEGMAGATGRMNIRIVSYTTDAEKSRLLEAFQKSSEDGLALLRTMGKGFINIEGQPGRKIEAVFSRDRQDGRELVVIGEHVASRLEQWQGVKPEDRPVAVIRLRFSSNGAPLGGEVFPAVKVAVTPDGFLDVQTDSSNKVIITDIARQ